MGRVLPILFNTDMVRAIQAGRKKVTRRVIKNQPDPDMPDNHNYCRMQFFVGDHLRTLHYMDVIEQNPFRQIRYFESFAPFDKGDILYVRETWKIHAVNPSFCMMIRYRADNFCNLQVKFSPSRFDEFQKFYEKNGWQSPYFMPKEAARIWLKVTDVRVERLQDMRPTDCLGEGIRFCGCPAGFTWKPDTDMKNCYIDAIGAMKALWDSTVKKTDMDWYGWDADPWVWVIKFERCEKPEREG